MSKPRNLFIEIADLRSRRSEDQEVLWDALCRLKPMISEIAAMGTDADLSRAQRELLKYGPICAVACIEGFMKGLIKNLVDRGSPYRDNIAKFEKLRPTIDVLLGLQDGKATLGEIVAHSVAISSIEDVGRSMDSVLGVGFFDNMRKWMGNSQLDGILAQVSHAFRLRHILAHELAPNLAPTVAEVRSINSATFELITLTHCYIDELCKDG